MEANFVLAVLGTSLLLSLSLAAVGWLVVAIRNGLKEREKQRETTQALLAVVRDLSDRVDELEESAEIGQQNNHQKAARVAAATKEH